MVNRLVQVEKLSFLPSSTSYKFIVSSVSGVLSFSKLIKELE